MTMSLKPGADAELIAVIPIRVPQMIGWCLGFVLRRFHLLCMRRICPCVLPMHVMHQ